MNSFTITLLSLYTITLPIVLATQDFTELQLLKIIALTIFVGLYQINSNFVRYATHQMRKS